MNRKHVFDQCSPLWGQLAKHNSLIVGGCSSAHQPTFFKLLDHVRRARTRHEDPIPDLAEPQCALVIQDFQDGELGDAESTRGKMRTDAPLNRLE